MDVAGFRMVSCRASFERGPIGPPRCTSEVRGCTFRHRALPPPHPRTCGVELTDVFRIPDDRSSRRADGGDGTHARRVRGRLHRQGGGRLRHASERNGRQCGSSRSCLSNKHDGYAEADRTPGSGGRLVSQPSRVWVLVVGCGHQHPAELRSTEPEGRSCCGGSDPKREREGCH
eukprot:scaffold587_cov339-Pavlova_lutheri.AAC.32